MRLSEIQAAGDLQDSDQLLLIQDGQQRQISVRALSRFILAKIEATESNAHASMLSAAESQRRAALSERAVENALSSLSGHARVAGAAETSVKAAHTEVKAMVAELHAIPAAAKEAAKLAQAASIEARGFKDSAVCAAKETAETASGVPGLLDTRLKLFGDRTTSAIETVRAAHIAVTDIDTQLRGLLPAAKEVAAQVRSDTLDARSFKDAAERAAEVAVRDSAAKDAAARAEEAAVRAEEAAEAVAKAVQSLSAIYRRLGSDERRRLHKYERLDYMDRPNDSGDAT